MKQEETTRDRIINVSNRLFYEQGYQRTAISDIVNELGLSKGNITYHFKSKDDILRAVIDSRLQKTRDYLSGLENSSHSPKKRLEKFVTDLLSGKNAISNYGCPNGTMVCELGKNEKSPLNINRQIFDEMRWWIAKQFQEATNLSEKKCSSYAMDLLTRAQGICVFSMAYQDESLFEIEVNKLLNWVRSTTKKN